MSLYSFFKHELIVTYYSNPDDLISEVSVGDTTGIVPSCGINCKISTLNCEVKSTELSECLWRRGETSKNVVVIRFPKSKNFPPGVGSNWMVKVIDRQGNLLITEIEDVKNIVLS